jgi:hypothetical protein
MAVGKPASDITQTKTNDTTLTVSVNTNNYEHPPYSFDGGIYLPYNSDVPEIRFKIYIE